MRTMLTATTTSCAATRETRISPERIGEQTDILGESPLWDDLQQCLYWIDIRRPAIRRFRLARGTTTGVVDTWTMPELIGSIALTADGRLLVAMPQQICMFNPVCGTVTPFVQPPPLPSGHRFNDGRCDAEGRFWVGSMHNITRAPEGVLFRLTGSGPMEAVRDGICIPNSLAFSPDGRTMYFADSLRHTIYAHQYDPATGAMGEASVFAVSEPPAFPDGSAVDAEGFVWNAEFNGGRLLRWAPDGSLDRVLHLPVRRPTCCTFGGPALDTLYITTTSQHMSDAERAAEPLAGALLAVKVDVPGLAERRFALPAAVPAASQ